MAGASVKKSLPRPCSGRKTLRRCQNNTATDNVVFIDVDGDDVENVIEIDSPELFSKKLRGSTLRKNKQHQKRVIILIDDEESTDNKGPDTGVKKRRHFSTDASSSKGPSAAAAAAAAENHDKVLNEMSDDVELVQESISSPLKISKCKRTYSGKAPSRNRYGIGSESDNDFSNDEFLDCELVEEDSSGSVREQWEKAFSKRKYENRNGQAGDVGCSKTSKASRNANYSGENVASKQHFPNSEPERSSSSPRNSAEEVDRATESSQLREKSETMKENSSRLSQEHREQASCNSKSENSSDHSEDRDYNVSPDSKNNVPQESGTEQLNSSRLSQEHCEQAFCNSTSESSSNDQSGNRDYNVSPDAKNNVPEENGAEVLNKSPSISISGKADSKRKTSSISSAIGNLSRELFSERGNFGGHILKTVLKGLHANNKSSTHSTLDPLAEESKTNCGESQYQQSFEYNNHRAENNGPPKCVSLQEKTADFFGSAERCMISDREKLKETDEYKKAMEEEWASRRLVLQVQAEEANQLRRLRKRENAERVRLLDMERRQKQRVEEIRETKKKDEEQMNMKNLIRAEVRNELSKVEKTCSDMVSLLRSLGIQVSSELRPNADEVRAACKRALFAFHPDRAAKSNNRQQVEAEEKFKLIIRMKEKFSVA